MSLIKKNDWFSNFLSDPFDEDKLQKTKNSNDGKSNEAS